MKKNNKKYAQGGDMNPLMATLLSAVPQGVNIASAVMQKPTYSPGGNNGFNWGNVLSSALAGGVGPQSIVGGALAGVAELIRDNKRDKTTVYGSPGQYSKGGDMKLSSSSFQVNAPANQTDAKYYPQFNARLDNDEVVDASRQIVFSNKLTNERTGNTYAKDAAAIERMKGAAEKKVTRHKDQFAKGSLSLLENMAKGLYMSQEAVATAQGHRPASKAMATGGPVDPISGLPLAWPSLTQPWARWSPPKDPVKNVQLTSNEWQDLSTGRLGPWNGPDTRVPVGNITLPEVTISGKRTTGGKPRAASNLPQINNPFKVKEDTDPYRVAMPLQKDTDPMAAFLAANDLGPGTPAPEYRPAPSLIQQDPTSTTSSSYVSQVTQPINKGFTTGDYVQMGSALASFAPLLQGPKVETPYMDNTPISKMAYDVAPQLQQSNRSYRNAVNGIDTQSPNVRRALQNAMLSQKLNNDNQIVSQYQQMNNQANTDYESRLSNQRRYNIGQQTYTDDLNTRNQGAFNTSLDNAFRTVGNFGSALNERQQAKDVMNLYKETYSDVYSRIINALSNKS